MPYETLNLGIELTLPTTGTSNWGTTLKNTTWTKISQHRHTGGGDGQQLVTASYAANSVTSAKLAKNIALGVAATLTPAGTTQTIDFDLGNIQTLDLSTATGDVTLSFSNPQAGAVYKIWVIQGAVFRDLIFPAGVKWPQAQAPILTQSNGAVDLVELYYTGSDYRGQWEVNWG
jgi:hypothetical protein